MSTDHDKTLPEDGNLESTSELTREPSRYVVGIDLGTTNSAVAYLDTRERWSGDPPVHTFEIPQLVAEGAVSPRPTLPSFLYLPGPHELPEGATLLPWARDRHFAIGEFARVQGARVPGHLVSSAKSWLCHGGVDRTAKILPWGGSDDVDKLSPVAVSARYLSHIREAWNHDVAQGDATLSLEHQDVVLTVPASFDEVARELTLEAAQAAGLERVHLLEEPQAAFYAWLATHSSTWSETLRPDRIILVCDIGGGTTDFSLIVTREGRQGLRFERVAVGEHLMLGGDNMDLAVARLIEARLTREGGPLDAQAMAGLIHACRSAKEELLGSEEAADDAAPAADPGRAASAHPAGWRSAVATPQRTVPIGVATAGANLVGGFLQSELSYEEARQIVVDGFFPSVPARVEPDRRKTGLREWGLPYVADAAVTKHLAAFLRRHRGSTGDSPHGASVGLARPDLILWNGAALTPISMRERLLNVVKGWFADEDPGYRPEVLENPDLRLAVAHGAAYYGIVRRGRGVRIHGGSARGYYVGVEVGARATAELSDPVGAVCLVRRGTEEGESIELDRGFEAHVNRPVSFSLYSSSVRTDGNGELVAVERDELVELPPIRTVLRFGTKAGERRLPVKIGAHLTEVGTLDLFCASQETDHRWRLRFQVRREPGEEEQAATATLDQGVTLDEDLVGRLEQLVRAAFVPGEAVSSSGGVNHNVTPQNLARHIRDALDLERDAWPLAALRKVAELLLEVRDHRRRSAAHEARWLNLTGFCLRPGFGYPMDDWRIRELWKISHTGVLHQNDEQCRTEWWILWRRVAGGLSRGQQDQLAQALTAPLVAAEQPKQQFAKKKAKGKGKGKKTKGGATSPRPKRLGKQERVEMWMAAASLEQLEPKRKLELGRLLLESATRGRATPQDLWALSRFGARVPFHGPANQVVRRKDAEEWIRQLLVCGTQHPRHTAHALAHLARRSGDRERDVDEALRGEVVQRLDELGAGASIVSLVTEGGALGDEEGSHVFGEALPAGLVLVEP